MLLVDGPRQHDDLAGRGAAPARTLASSRSRRPASEAPGEAVRPRLATARDAIHRRASRRTPAQGACPSERLRATLRRARVRARTRPDAVRARPPCLPDARHGGMRPRRARSTPATLRPPPAGGVAPRHSQSAARRAWSGRAMRFRPPPSAPGSVRGAPRARPGRAQRAPPSSGARRIAMPATTSSCAVLDAGGNGAGSSSASVRSASSSRPIRSETPDLEMARVRGVQPIAVLLRASPAPRRAPSQASPGRATRARFRPRRRRTCARATASLGPKARAARRRRAFARTRSPS